MLDKRDGRALPETGGFVLFVNPDLMWTYRNYAVTIGPQIPAVQDLNGDQHETDYRFAFEVEGRF